MTTYEKLEEIIVNTLFQQLGTDESDRDLNLEDVLIVIEGAEFFTKPLHWDVVGGYLIAFEDNQESLFDWQLGKPLHEQSEETQKFLLEILDK